MASEKEFRLLDALAREEYGSQRQVARDTGLSLGMVNLVLRRMAKTGYIKVAALDGQTVRYVLTPKGTAELARRSYEYLLHVISTFGDLRSGIADLIAAQWRRGKRLFIIYGTGDVADIAELACRSSRLSGLRWKRQANGRAQDRGDTAVLDCRIGAPRAPLTGIHVLSYLARQPQTPKGGSEQKEKHETADARR